jgi:prepilin-type N-terminal cleavage/methylation domain-containing protein
MAPHGSPKPGPSGYTVIEMLVVLAIVAILSIAAVTMLGNRGGNSVREVLDQLEGALLDAQKYAVSTGKDVAIVTWGAYDTTVTVPTANTLCMARGLTSLTSANPALATYSLAIQDVVLNPPATPTPIQQTVSLLFSSTRSREYLNVGVVTTGSNGWTNSMLANSSGKRNVDITTVAPFNADATFIAANTPANNLFTGALNQVTISGANKRFNNAFIIQVVGTSGGFALPGGAMGLIVVLNNGASVYKFYNPGVNKGDGQWRRI